MTEEYATTYITTPNVELLEMCTYASLVLTHLFDFDLLLMLVNVSRIK